MDHKFLRALGEGDVNSIRTLLDGGVNIDTVDCIGATALHHVSVTGRLEMARMLLDRGANIDARTHYNKETALMRAGYAGHIEIVRVLLDRGAEIDAKNSNGLTALHFAVDNYAICHLLLVRGADTTIRNNRKETALDTALRHRKRGQQRETVELLKHVMNVDNTAYLQCTPFNRLPKELTELLLTYL